MNKLGLRYTPALGWWIARMARQVGATVARAPRSKFLLALLAGVCLGVLVLSQSSRVAANPLAGIASISTGDSHTCVVTDAGGVKCWGYGDFGQLGNGTNGTGDWEVIDDVAFVPVDVCADQSCEQSLSDIAAVSAGGAHTCALTTSGGVKCWGGNEAGQLGVEGVYCYGVFIGQFPCSNTPVDVPGLESGVTAISAGQRHTCAVLEDGSLKCWGINNTGQLGIGTVEQCGGTHPPCPGPTDVCQDYDTVAQQCIQPLSGVSAVAAGPAHTCALTTAGGVKCWGHNGGGTLGDGTTESRLTPVDVIGLDGEVTAIAVGGLAASCAVMDDGGVQCWGGNGTGSLGNGTVDFDPHPSPEDVCQSYDTTAQQCSQPLSGAVAVTVGPAHTCALTGEHRVKCWGDDLYGQLGDGQPSGAGMRYHPTPVDVVNLDNATAVGAGFDFACALTQAGGAKCWGYAWGTSLGDGGGCYICSTPVDVVAATRKTPTPTPVITPNPSATPPGCEPHAGDADGNCTVDSRDALLILQWVAGMLDSLPESRNADVNGNGVINSIDAQLILQYVSGLICTLDPNDVCLT
jgi:alpha-tubulin suppressor-like RCC1 family protein